LIDTIKLLHLSGENITKIKGFFRNIKLFIQFSAKDVPFSEILKEAIDNGFRTGSKRGFTWVLLILARELDLQNEFEEIDIQNLIPEHLRKEG
jgi:aspartokinase/homoserine dehydrogenase 1